MISDDRKPQHRSGEQKLHLVTVIYRTVSRNQTGKVLLEELRYTNDRLTIHD